MSLNEQIQTKLPEVVMFATLELSMTAWLLAAQAIPSGKTSNHRLSGGDVGSLLALLRRLQEREQRSSGWEVTIIPGYEAIAAYAHDWLADEFSRGTWAIHRPGWYTDYHAEMQRPEGNVLLALSGKTTTPSAISSLLLEFDLHLSNDRSSIVLDHFNYDTVSASEKHDVLLLQRPGQLRPDTKAFFDGDGVLAFPRAIPQTLGDSSNIITPILRAPVTSYSYNPKEESFTPEDVQATGSQLALVSAMQARNSARFAVLGSVESLEDKWFSANVKAPKDKKEAKTANQEFAKQLTSWTFKETGVLKVGKIEHHLAEEGEIPSEKLNPPLYRIKNETVSDSRYYAVDDNNGEFAGLQHRGLRVC